LVFFHHDFLVDIERSDAGKALKMLQHELLSGSFRLPYRFGRILYDKFNDIPGDSLIEHLLPQDVDSLLQDTEQGIYQVGRFVTGPLGILESEDRRYIPPAQAVPLWHCADPGCQKLHDVTLLKHDNGAYSLAEEIEGTAERLEGPASDWKMPIRRTSLKPGRNYYDLPVLIAEAMSPSERAELVVSAFKTSGGILRAKLKSAVGGKKLEEGSPDAIARRLTDGSKLQLLMTLKDVQLVRLIDSAKRWARLFEQPFRVDKWSVCRG
jgi:hypothetical protein